MKNKNHSDLASRFMAWSKANRRASLGAVALVSLSASRSLADETGADRLVRATVAAHSTDDTILDPEQIGAVSQLESEETESEGHALSAHLLTPLERKILARDWQRKPIAVADPIADPSNDLPVDFSPAPVDDYRSETVGLLSPDELATIDRESAAEVAEIERVNARDLAAVDFRSDFDGPFPVDYAPAVPAVARSVATPPVVSEAEALRLAVLSLSRR